MVMTMFDSMAAVLPQPEGIQATQQQWLTLLASLSPVLCLYQDKHWSPLAGLEMAQEVQLHSHVHPDGVDECLALFDADQKCCWKLYRLPCSREAGWAKLERALPCVTQTEPHAKTPPKLFTNRDKRIMATRSSHHSSWLAAPMMFNVYNDAQYSCLYARDQKVGGVCASVVSRVCRQENARCHQELSMLLTQH